MRYVHFAPDHAIRRVREVQQSEHESRIGERAKSGRQVFAAGKAEGKIPVSRYAEKEDSYLHGVAPTRT
jgi:hypothetical protein